MLLEISTYSWIVLSIDFFYNNLIKFCCYSVYIGNSKLFCDILNVAKLKVSVLSTGLRLLRAHCQRVFGISKGLRARPAWIKMLRALLLIRPRRATHLLRFIAV